MARIRSFRALRYDVPDLSAVVAPPYDVISEEQRAEYLARIATAAREMRGILDDERAQRLRRGQA
jgi:hypothetical protein